MEKPAVRISVRNLVEFILRSGDLDNRRGAGDKEAMLKGSRLHRKIQSRMGSEYRAEVSMKLESEYEDVRIIVEGRADGIFTEDDQVWIDEIKGVYADIEKMEEPVAVHKAQAKCYAWICAREQGLERAGVQMTYGNLDTEEMIYLSHFQHAITIHLNGKEKERFRGSIQECEKQLQIPGFIKINQGCIANIRYCRRINARNSTITMENGAILSVSRECMEKTKREYMRRWK